ncbi:zinc-dependent alcohol dehydrogenase family protein [Ramlibacter ginsenosidimutans]|uniref:Zinc-dependent alcohol dehydrogenase family protein n=1 Tax=Ramlibacter ginsenosidimutans TaxID=502333 RepID=A0A934WL81_9BURK|nr:zinc-dependent alcohol dehydrogenase family protein [Ramlibacter ginsenosidimutans]MBK6005345.1 zinc-dependent alcohol dehydrogenase family protein [Ramlibacter ginsenosidimutans]
MLAMEVDAASHTLRAVRKPVPVPGAGEVLLKVRSCGVCRTDLHILDGELPVHRENVVPGHEVVGEVVGLGAGSGRFGIGQRVGVPWLGRACGHCGFCRTAHENLCDEPQFTGYDRDGGYAEYAVADERFCFALPAAYDDLHAAPLLCAGLIGYRTWRLAGGADAQRVGLWGFGAAAHIVCQLAVAQGQQVFAFTRPGDVEAQAFARSLGATWAGGSDESPPERLDASLLFAPAGPLVPAALALTRKGGVVVCGGIHMSDIPAFAYELLWGERQVRSVANLTRADGEGFFTLIARVPVRTEVQAFPLAQANDAVRALRAGSIRGAAVMVP